MNKTVNINLAGIFFHIDEDAYLKLQHYLDAIKRSFTNAQGRDEIIADIEARIGELFNEKLKNERQVISIKEVQEVIDIMGQPEDYMLDEEIFEDEPVQPEATTTKKLFRDTENAYLGGVSSGLGHYLGIDPIWIRLLWVLFTLFSTGAFILVYLVFWILVPEAHTTAQKLSMRGKAANISNIERKIREGFDDVSEKVKGMDYQKYGSHIRSGSNSAATAVGNFITTLAKIIIKLIGIFLILIAGSTLIGLFVGLFTVGTFGIIEAPWSDYIEMAVAGAPLWVISLLSFLAVGIPFFFLFILGLKMIIKNLKSFGNTASLVLLGIWIVSLVGLGFIGIQQATGRAFEGEVVKKETLNVTAGDTLYLGMRNNSNFSSSMKRSSNFSIKQGNNNNKVLYSTDVRLIVRSTKDSLARMEIIKTAQGKDSRSAKDRASNINYTTSFSNHQLLLDSYFTTGTENKYRDQEVQVILYLPEGSVLFGDKNTYSFHKNRSHYEDIFTNGDEEEYLTIMDGEAICLDCPVAEYDESEEWDSDYDFNAQAGDENVNITISKRDSSKNGKRVKSIRIDRNGVEIRND